MIETAQEAVLSVRRAYPSATIKPLGFDPDSQTYLFAINGETQSLNAQSGIISTFNDEVGMSSEFYPEKL